jgi:hypothetical protein
MPAPQHGSPSAPQVPPWQPPSMHLPWPPLQGLPDGTQIPWPLLLARRSQQAPARAQTLPSQQSA